MVKAERWLQVGAGSALVALLAFAVPAAAQVGGGLQVPLSAYGSVTWGNSWRLEAGLPLDFNLSSPGLTVALKWFLLPVRVEEHPFRWYAGARAGVELARPLRLHWGALTGLTLALPEPSLSLFGQVELGPSFERGLPFAVALGLHWGL